MFCLSDIPQDLDHVGPSLWSQRFLTFVHLDHIPQIVNNVPDIGLNEAFIFLCAFLLAFDIVSRYHNAFECIESH